MRVRERAATMLAEEERRRQQAAEVARRAAENVARIETQSRRREGQRESRREIRARELEEERQSGQRRRTAEEELRRLATDDERRQEREQRRQQTARRIAQEEEQRRQRRLQEAEQQRRRAAEEERVRLVAEEIMRTRRREAEEEERQRAAEESIRELQVLQERLQLAPSEARLNEARVELRRLELDLQIAALRRARAALPRVRQLRAAARAADLQDRFSNLLRRLTNPRQPMLLPNAVINIMPGRVGRDVTYQVTESAARIIGAMEQVAYAANYKEGVVMMSTILATLALNASVNWRLRDNAPVGKIVTPIEIQSNMSGWTQRSVSLSNTPTLKKVTDHITRLVLTEEQQREVGVDEIDVHESDRFAEVEGQYPQISTTTDQHGMPHYAIRIVIFPSREEAVTGIVGATKSSTGSTKLLPGGILATTYPAKTASEGYCLLVAYRNLIPEGPNNPLSCKPRQQLRLLFRDLCHKYADVIKQMKLPVTVDSKDGLPIGWARIFELEVGCTVPIIDCTINAVGDGISGAELLSPNESLPPSERCAAIGWCQGHFFNILQLPVHFIRQHEMPAVPTSVPEDPQVRKYYKWAFDANARARTRQGGETMVMTENGPRRVDLPPAFSDYQRLFTTNTTLPEDDIYDKARQLVFQECPRLASRVVSYHGKVQEEWLDYYCNRMAAAIISGDQAIIREIEAELAAEREEWKRKRVEVIEGWTRVKEEMDIMTTFRCREVDKEEKFIWPLSPEEDEILARLVKEEEDHRNAGSPTTQVTFTAETKEHRWLFMDLETFIDKSNGCQTYSLVAYLHQGGLDNLPRSANDINNDNPNFFFVAGVDETATPLAKFCRWLQYGEPAKYHCHIQAFNGSRFDHILLVQECQKRELLVPSTLLIVKNAILQAVLRGGHTIHDLSRFLGGSLKANCGSFKTERKKVDGFDHNLVQRKHDAAIDATTGKWSPQAAKQALNDWIAENYSKLREYNVMDVLALAELTLRFEMALDELVPTLLTPTEGKPPLDVKLWNYLTVASMAKDIMLYIQKNTTRDVNIYPEAIEMQMKAKEAKLQQKIQALHEKIENFISTGVAYGSSGVLDVNPDEYLAKLNADMAKLEKTKLRKPRKLPHITMASPPDSLELNRWIRRSFFAGRVQSLAPGGRPITRRGIIQMLDICSSYPNVMLRELFPAGDHTKTTVEVPGKLGVYNCTIVSQNRLVTIPRRTKGEALDWWYNGSQENVVLNSVDIEHIRSKGGEVIVHDGYYWELSTRDQFINYIMPIFELKKRLDDAAGTPNANPALRAVAKLFLNSVSGKVGEKPHFDIVRLCGSAAESYTIMEDIDDEHEMSFSTGWKGATLIKGRMSEEAQARSYYTKLQRSGGVSPTITASFIYAYARRNLYVALEYAGDWGYCDTDSCVMLHEDYLRMIRDHPELFRTPGVPKELGQWDAELIQDGTMSYTFSVKGAKEYAIFPDSPGGGAEEVGKAKVRTKGVSGRDLYIPPEEVDLVRAMTASERAAWAESHQHLIFLPNKDDVSKWDAEHRQPTVRDDGVEIPVTQRVARESFEVRTRGEKTYWLCLQFKRAISGDGASVYIHHLIKEY